MSNDCQYHSILFVAVDNAPTGPNDAALCANSQTPMQLCSQHAWRVYQVEIADSIFGSVPRLGPLDFGGYGYAADFTKVPEPGTLSLLGFGLAGMGFMRRRRKN
jgi:PEP-CTERM motif